MQDWIKSYTLKALEKKEKLNFRTLKKRKTEYIPVKFVNWQIRAMAKSRKGKWLENPQAYSVKYIRMKDLQKYLKDISKDETND